MSQDIVLRARLQFVADDPGAWNSARANAQALTQNLVGLRNEMRTANITQSAFMQGLRQMGTFARHTAGDFGEFELILKRTEGLLGGMDENLQRIRRFAMADRSTEFTPTQLAQGMLELARAGSEGAETLRDIKTVADVATVAEYDLTRASVAVANAQQAWGGSMNMTTRELMTRFVNAANASTFELGNLIQAMGLSQGAALTYNQSLTTTLASLAMLAPITGANTKAGTAFAASLRAIADAKKQAKLKSLGIKLIDEESGDFRQLPYIVADFVEKTSKMATEKGASITKAIFGERGTREVAAIMRVMERGVTTVNGQFVRGRAAIDAWYEKIEKGKMSLQEQAELTRTSLPMRWAQLKANMQRLFIEMGEKLAPALKAIVSGLTTLAGALEHVFSGKLGTVLIFTGGILALKAAMSGLHFVVGALAPSLAAMRGGALAGLAGAGAAAAPTGAGVAGAAAQGFLSQGLLSMRNPVVDARIAAMQGGLAQRSAGLGWGAVANSAAGNSIASATARAGSAVVSAGSRVLGFVGGIASALTSPLALLAGGIWGAVEAFDYFRKRAAARKEKDEKYQLLADNFDLVGLSLKELYTKGGLTNFRMQNLEAQPMLKWALGAAMTNLSALQGLPDDQRAGLLKKTGFKSEGQFALSQVAAALRERMITEDVPEATRQLLLDKFLRSAGDLAGFGGKKYDLKLERLKDGDKANIGELGDVTDPTRGVLSSLQRLNEDPTRHFGAAVELGKQINNVFSNQGLFSGSIFTALQAAGWTGESLNAAVQYATEQMITQWRTAEIALKVTDEGGRILTGAGDAKVKFQKGLQQ